MPSFVDRTGLRYDKLVAIMVNPTSKPGAIRWICLCDCGNYTDVSSSSLGRGDSGSCGCGNSCFRPRPGRDVHGMTRTPEHKAWLAMKYRCSNPNADEWDNYGGRGIVVCERWKNSFLAFYEDMGPRPSPKHSIDRKNNNLGYNPENCIWATDREQTRNKRTNNNHTYNDKTQCLTDWAAELGVPLGRLRGRIELGWSFKDAVEVPMWGRPKKRLFPPSGRP